MAAALTRRTVENLFRGHLTPLLAPRGFARRGRTYRLVSPAMDYMIVNVRASSGFWREEYVFYVTVGVAREPWLDYILYRDSPDGRQALPGIEHARLSTSIDPPRDTRWTMDTSLESADRVGRQIIAALEPKIDEAVQLLDRETLLARGRARDLAGWTVDYAALVLSLLAAKGQSQELIDLLDSHRWSLDFGTWAWERAEQSTSGP